MKHRAREVEWFLHLFNQGPGQGLLLLSHFQSVLN